MNDQPIYVTIKDEKNLARGLSWLAKGAKWLAAGGTVTVDYDPWSCADRNQQACMANAINNGSISMTINVLNDVGEYVSVPYCPGKSANKAFIQKQTAPAAAVGVAAPKAQPAQIFRQADNGTHTVVAGVNKFASKYKLNAVDVTPPGGTPNAYGFAKVGDAAPEGADTGLRKAADAQDKPAEPASAPVPDPVHEPAPAPAPKTAEQSAAQCDADKFNALLAEKKWSEAYKLLKAHFGEDKVTFSQRSLQYIGSWEALVSKYGLDE